MPLCIFKCYVTCKVISGSVSGTFVYELKCSCESVYNGKTKKKIICRLSKSTNKKASKVIGHPLEQPNGHGHGKECQGMAKECHGHFDWLHPKTVSMKNRYYDRRVRESLGLIWQ